MARWTAAPGMDILAGMTEEQHSTEASTDEAATDPREQMRVALERKNQKAQQGEAHLDGHAKAGGPHAKAGGPREFRRKSG